MEINDIINTIYILVDDRNLLDIDKIYHTILIFFVRYLDEFTCKSFNVNLRFCYESLLNQSIDEKYENFYNNPFINIPLDKRLKRKQTLYNILPLLRDINPSIYKKSLIYTIYEAYPDTIYDDIHNNITYSYISQYIAKVIMLDKDYRIKSIIDPIMGNGDLLCYLAKEINDENLKVFGFDTKRENIDIAQMNYIFNMDKVNENFTVMNCLTTGIENQYDLVVSNIPISFSDFDYKICCDQIKSLNIIGSKSEALYILLFTKIIKLN
jgi:hypothetical protein